MKQSIWVLLITVLLMVQPFSGLAQDNPCPGAPPPQLVVGQQGQIAPGSANNMRDQPSTAGRRVGAIEAGDIITILEGPICADGFNWWRIDYNGFIGWTVEGQDTEYWIFPVREETPTPAPTLIPTPTPVPIDVPNFTYPLAIDNELAIGTQARLNTGGDQQLVRAEAGTSGVVVTRLDDGAMVTITDGPREANGFRWWQIETVDVQSGWTIEGLMENDYRDRPIYVQTLFPLCPHNTDRLAFVADGMVMTSNMAGEQVCNLTELIGPHLHTFWPYFFYMPNSVHWSPDGSQLMYISWPTLDSRNYDLFTIRADGGTVQRLTTDSAVLWADWSPDGSRIAVARALDGQINPQIWVMDADGSRPSALTAENILHPWVEWLDSDTVVYVTQSQQLQQVYREITYTFHIVGANGSAPRQLWTTTMDVRSARVSPDGAYLAVAGFNWVEGEPAGSQIVVLDVTTGEIVLTREGSTVFLWSPDGLLGVLDGGELILTDFNGAESRVDMELMSWMNTSDDSAWANDGGTLFAAADGALISVDTVNGVITTLFTTDATVFDPIVQPAGQ